MVWWCVIVGNRNSDLSSNPFLIKVPKIIIIIISPAALISLTHSRHPSLLSFASGWSSRLHLVSVHRADVSLYWSAKIGTSMYKCPKKNIAYEFVLVFFPAVGRAAVALWSVASSAQHYCVVTIYPFSLCILLASMWCIHTVVWTQLQFGRNPVLFYRIDQISIRSITGQ